MSNNKWDADPEKYKSLAVPFESPEEAEKVAEAFLNAVRGLRENYRIPELTIQFIVYVKQGDGIVALNGGAGWGDQLKQLRLAKSAFDREYSRAFSLQTEFLTDPRIEGGEAA